MLYNANAIKTGLQIAKTVSSYGLLGKALLTTLFNAYTIINQELTMASADVILHKGTETTRVSVDKPTLSSDYERIDVKRGQWIVYDHSNYTADTVVMSQVYTGPTGLVDLPFTPRSIRQVPTYHSEGVTLYEHGQFGGRAIGIANSTPDLQLGNGISSVIVNGSRWRFYENKDFQDPGRNLAPGQYATPAAMGFPNDRLKSIEKLD